MARLTVDFEKLMFQLLDAALPMPVLPAVDVDTLADVPCLLYSGANGAMIQNGAPGLGWEWRLDLVLIAPDRATGGDLADETYQAVHGFEGKTVDGVGGVSTVADVSMFARTGSAALEGSNLQQYDASFTVRVRKASY